MSEEFDPYLKWLGIPAKHQPADHYRLLGVERFEADIDVIESAADRQMAHIRSFRSGKRVELSEKILNELSAAKACLLSPERRAKYDEKLKSLLAARAAKAKAARPAEPAPVASPPSMAAAAAGSAKVTSSSATAVAESGGFDLTSSRATTTPASRIPAPRKKQSNNQAMILAGVGALALILIVGVVMSGAFDSDPAKPAPSVAQNQPTAPVAAPANPAATPANKTTPPSGDAATPSGTDSSAPAGGSDNASPPNLKDGSLAIPPVDKEDRSKESPGENDSESSAEGATPPNGKPLFGDSNQNNGDNGDNNTGQNGENGESDKNEGVKTPPVDEKDGRPSEDETAESKDTPVELKPVEKRPVPALAEQTAVETQAKKVYLLANANDIDGRRSLAQKLFGDGATSEKPVEQFVLLQMAIENAADAGDMVTVGAAIEKLESLFVVNGGQLRSDAIDRMTRSTALSNDQKHAAFVESLALIDAVMLVGEFSNATQITTKLSAQARRFKDNDLSNQLQERRKKAASLADLESGARGAQAALEKNPNDVAAKLTLGKFEAFVKKNWESALPMLAAGDANLPLVKAAKADLAGKSADANSQAEIGDAWFAAGAGAADFEKLAIWGRADHWYALCLPDLTGLTATVVKKNQEEIAKLGASSDTSGPRLRYAKLIASADSECEMALNGEILFRNRSQRDDEGRPEFPRAGGDRGDRRRGMSFKPTTTQHEFEVTKGDLLIVHARNRLDECGFACVIELADISKLTQEDRDAGKEGPKTLISTSVRGPWQAFQPTNVDDWMNPKSIGATGAPILGTARVNELIMQESKRPSDSIWSINTRNENVYFLLRVP